MSTYVLDFNEIDQTQVSVVGGKGARLGELSQLGDIPVPPGFCVTTAAWQRVMADELPMSEQLDQLSLLKPHDADAVSTLTAEIRRGIEGLTIPDDMAGVIVRAVDSIGAVHAYAVRSSATAEDQPAASFAGQHDTFLNVVGSSAILERMKRCWASLFTERAVIYRMQQGVDHRIVGMVVVVQQMVFAESSGVLFTADPMTSNRKITSIEAVFGLGEALVSGRVNADVYQVRDGEVTARSVVAKALGVHPDAAGGTQEVPIDTERQTLPALTDEQIVRISELGRRIEGYLGSPQNIEWCLVDDEFQIVQSRPIATLFPVPVQDDGEDHVYVSVGHQQMMTDPMKPLGLSFWQRTTRRQMFVAGGRLFVDVARDLASPTSRAMVVGALGRSDPLIGDALETIVERGDFFPLRSDESLANQAAAASAPEPIETDPAIVTGLIERTEVSIASLKPVIERRSGSALFDFIQADLEELKTILVDPLSSRVIMAGMEAAWWLSEHLQDWLGEKHASDTLAQSVPYNVSAEMGRALLDVADAIRPHPGIVAFLHQVKDEGFLDEIMVLEGGPEARAAIEDFLERYGMRCVGEIDITRPRWSERPSTLVLMILSNVENFAPGAGSRHFEQGRRDAADKEREILARLRGLPEGDAKAEETKRMIDRLRTFSGYREYPKYGMICRYFVYKRAMLEQAERLVRDGVLRTAEDIFYLTFEELEEVVRTRHAHAVLIEQRRVAFESYWPLTPPRVFTSEGEVVTGSYKRADVPLGALVGRPVSAGTVEGRARVIVSLADADLTAGDILVTPYTDPSWTPAFVAIAGLMTEVGGLMTHGAVIAREYGLPAVVGVEHATRLIADGQTVRVNGTDGFVEVLP